MLRFRPHHFMCTLGFEGKGYSPEFVRNYVELKAGLTDETEIDVVAGSDSICMPCPNRRGDACETEAKIRKLDDGHARVLGIAPGDRLRWDDARALIAEKMSEEDHQRVCEPCGWRDLGICLTALRKVKYEELAG